MKVQIINPLKMQWESGYKNIFPCSTWNISPDTGYDINIFMWCDKTTVDFINKSESGKNIVFIRRYEWFTGYWRTLDYSKVQAFIFVNDYFAFEFEKITGIKPYVVYNGVTPEKWAYKQRKHGNKIAIVGFINQKKNLPLAIQILAALPEGYTLHLAGEVQDYATMDYIDNLSKSMKRKVYFYGCIDNIDLWLEDKNYLLSTAISEGCPNNVIEAMAKGIKPIVHNWPGAREQFGEAVFDTAIEALTMMSPESPYESGLYRKTTEEKFGLNNYLKVKEIVGTWM